MRVLWITNRPIAAGETRFNLEPTSGTWMAPTLNLLSKHNDIKLFVATVANVSKTETMLDNGVEYYFLPKDKKRIYRYNSDKHLFQWRAVLNAIMPDIVMVWGTEYAHSLSALMVSKEMGIPSVIEIQGIMETIEYYYLSNMTKKEIRDSYSIRNLIKNDGLYEEQRFYRKKAIIEKKMLQCTNNIIVENEWAKSHCKYINPNCVFYFHHQNVDESFFEKSWSLEKCEPCSIFTSFPGYPLKGLHILIKAVALLKNKYENIRLYIPGMVDPFSKKNIVQKIKRQGYEKYIMNLIVKLGLKNNIVFLGRLTPRQMAERMQKSNVMVIASSVENTSTTIREAMTVGTPCVGSFAGGIPETIIHGKNGFVFRHEEFVLLADYIGRIFDNNDLAVEFSENGRKYMYEYLDTKKSTSDLLSIYEKIISLNGKKCN